MRGDALCIVAGQRGLGIPWCPRLTTDVQRFCDQFCDQCRDHWRKDRALNRPGESGDSVSWEGWSHVWSYVEAVPGRAA